jgi:hypothetical protein
MTRTIACWLSDLAVCPQQHLRGATATGLTVGQLIGCIVCEGGPYAIRTFLPAIADSIIRKRVGIATHLQVAEQRRLGLRESAHCAAWPTARELRSPKICSTGEDAAGCEAHGSWEYPTG